MGPNLFPSCFFPIFQFNNGQNLFFYSTNRWASMDNSLWPRVIFPHYSIGLMLFSSIDDIFLSFSGAHCASQIPSYGSYIFSWCGPSLYFQFILFIIFCFASTMLMEYDGMLKISVGCRVEVLASLCDSSTVEFMLFFFFSFSFVHGLCQWNGIGMF